ncbi:MAG: hypothetical protein D3903_19635 [Candidatus Electrothrix sp. GM3_4]|nr:hypothetical protein [Candidatus Electrothrix sp. GM3_4]
MRAEAKYLKHLLGKQKNHFMRIQITEKKVGCFAIVWVIVSLLHVSISEATEFYLSVEGSARREHCDSLEIKSNKISCTKQNMVISYDLNAVSDVEIVDKEKIHFISRFTSDSIDKINSFNQRGRNSKETDEKIKRSKVGYLVHRLKSIDSFADAQKLGESQYEKYGLSGVLHIFLPLVGALLVLAGFLGLILAAFRVHILWGLSCRAAGQGRVIRRV